MTNNSSTDKSARENRRFSFKHKRLATILAIAAAVVLIASLPFSGLFALSPDPSTQPSPTPTETPPSPTPTATPSPTPIPIPADFTCYDGGSAFTVAVDVDLNDGMDRDEAVAVATTILKHELTDPLYELKSAQLQGDIWTVDFNWEYKTLVTLPDGSIGTLGLGHFFDVTVNAQNRTASYSRCL